MTTDEPGIPQAPGGLDALRRFTSVRHPIERCELCGEALNPAHPHLLQLKTRRIACSCRACALLFSDQQSERFLRIPDRVVSLRDFTFTDGEWNELMLPIGLVFFVRETGGRIAAYYPGPAGIVESLVPVGQSAERFGAHPVLSGMRPEVEALLVNRVGSAGANHAYFLVPIDECFRLAGLIRQNWRGLSGGASAWSAVAGFFDELQQRSRHNSKVSYA